jgi:hypothetical protein
MLLVMFFVDVLRFQILQCAFLGLVSTDLDTHSSAVSAGAGLEVSIEATERVCLGVQELLAKVQSTL